MTTRIILVRHGQTEWNHAGRFMGQTDIPLNDTGVQQAQAVAGRLSGERPQAIYASDLSRAWQTAGFIHGAICSAMEMDLREVRGNAAFPVRAHGGPRRHNASTVQPATEIPPLIAEPRLREMNFGAWQGSTYAELQAGRPQELATWEADLVNAAPPGGESLLQMAGRARAAFDNIIAAHPDGTVIIVAHGGPLQALMVHIFGLPLERYWQFHLSNTGWVELNIYPSGAVLNRFNDLNHLELPKGAG